jgi:hypothetical protein
MAAQIHVLRPRVPPLGGFLRVGHTGYRKLEALQVAGRFPYRRVVFDAAHIGEQHFLLRHLDPAVRSARFGARLKIVDEKVAKAVGDVKASLVRLRDALADLQATEGAPSRSRSPHFRGGTTPVSAVLGR